MPNMVQIRVTSSGKVTKCEEKAARRVVKANPKEYRIIEPPVIEVAELPAIKKKVAVESETVLNPQDSDPINIGQPPSDKPAQNNPTTNKMDDVLQGRLKPTKRARRTKK